jgi:GAF domain-containing protein
MPILAPGGPVLGTFGTYFRSRRAPTTEERKGVELLAAAAALALAGIETEFSSESYRP